MYSGEEYFDDSNEKGPMKTKCINLYLKDKRIDHQSSRNARNGEELCLEKYKFFLIFSILVM